MLEDKEVELFKRVKEADCWSQRESNLQDHLQRANELLLQRDRELKAERQRAEKVALERKEVEKVLQEQTEKLRDAAYACYEQGFDKTLAQVKHFAKGALVDLSKVDQERKLDEILAVDAPTSQGVLVMVVGHWTLFKVKEEEEGGKTPICYLDLS